MKLSLSLTWITAIAVLIATLAFGPVLDLPEAAATLPVGIALAGMIVNEANLANLFTGFKAAFNTGFRGITPMWMSVATRVPSSAAKEDYGWLGQFPRLREWIGERQIKKMAAQKYSIANRPFEGSIAVMREDIERDQYGVYNPLFAEMGHASATHPDELVLALLAASFTTTCYDGQYMVDTDHPVGDASVSNSGGGSGAAWFLMDCSRPLKPLIFQVERDYQLLGMTTEGDEAVFMRREFRYGVDARCNVGFGFWQQMYGSKQTLDKTAFDSAMAAMMGFKSDEGRPLGIRPTHLVCGPSNRAAALSVVGTQRLASGADNPNYNAVQIVISPWLS
jgi:phage major head subunit gpT-like protein